MLFILTVLVLFIANVNSDEDDYNKYGLPLDMEMTFEEINKKYKKRTASVLRTKFSTQVWDNALAENAYEEAHMRPSWQYFDMKIRAAKKFIKSDNRTLDEKVRLTLEPYMKRRRSKLALLPTGSFYGCDGIFNTKGGDNLMVIVCLYLRN